MKMKLSAFIVLIVPLLIQAQSLETRYKQLGSMFIPQFSSAPFPHPERKNGHRYGTATYPAETHYSDSSVAIFIPKGFTPEPTLNLVIYIHGWNNSIDSACAQFSLIEQFAGSKKNAVFVFPEGPKDAPDSFGGRLEEEHGLKNLVDDVIVFLMAKNVITKAKLGSIVLSGHSGAYRVISYCLMRGGLTENVSDVILFDALYGQTEKYAYWIDHYKGRFINIYTDNGGTKNKSENLMADLDGWNIRYHRAEESAVTAEDLKNNRLIFIHSALGHNDVISARNQFRDVLRSGTLPPIR